MAIEWNTTLGEWSGGLGWLGWGNLSIKIITKAHIGGEGSRGLIRKHW